MFGFVVDGLGLWIRGSESLLFFFRAGSRLTRGSRPKVADLQGAGLGVQQGFIVVASV